MTARSTGLSRLSKMSVLLAVGVLLAGCSVPVKGAESSSSVAAVVTPVAASAVPVVPGTLVVTVPALPAGPLTSSPALKVTGSTAHPKSDLPTVNQKVATPALNTSGLNTSPATPAASTAPRTSAAPTSAATSSATSASPTPAASPAPTIAVQLANCDSCTVLATHKSVAGNYSAALIANGQGRAVLLSLHPDGSVGSVMSVPYGSTFASPADKTLPCDSGGRCLVIGQQPDGTAVGSAFALSAAGVWTDVSVPGGFVSSTSVAEIVNLDGEPGIAVQDSDANATVWVVYAWGSDGYDLTGCAPATGALDPVQLAMTSCLS